jgi:hypothetical protein
MRSYLTRLQLNLGVSATAIHLRILLAFYLLGTSACDDRSGAFRPMPIDSALTAALALDTGTVVSLDSLGPRAWTALYFIGPYSTDAQVHRCVAPTGPLETYGIASRDDIVAFYFKRENGRVSAATFPWRGHLDRSALGREYPRGNAAFVVRYDSSSGQKRLYPAGALTRSCS